MAIRKALSTRERSRLSAMAQPTMRREYKSRITARYNQPAAVGMKVMSPNHF